MRAAAKIIAALAAHNARLAVDGDRVRVSFPAGHPPPATLVEAARAHREELREVLKAGAAAERIYGGMLAALKSKCPEAIEFGRWQRAIKDADLFLISWAGQAAALSWTPRELFGLADVPARPAANYQRLSRYDQLGLIWLLQGRRVVALTKDTAVIETAIGTVSFYRLRRDEPRVNRGHHGTVKAVP
jgi:hypothetical protein